MKKSIEAELISTYKDIKKIIVKKFIEFDKIFKNGSNKDIFLEMAFCLLTPQSKARVCWEAINKLKEKQLLFSDNQELISNTIRNVRFKNNKAKYIILAKKFFTNKNKINIKDIILTYSDNLKLREFFVTNIKGMAYKEASHFLRNIGYGENIAILDRHILRNMLKYKLISEIPKTITKKNYLHLENLLINFSKKTNIPMSHLDFVLWYQATGDIFK